MSDTESQATKNGTATKAVPPIDYEPKAIFLDVWARIVPAWLDGEGGAAVWATTAGHVASAGKVIGTVTRDTYEKICLSIIHGWLAIELEHMGKKHDAQSDAYRTIAMAALQEQGAHLTGCVAYDVASGTMRECKHDEGEEHEGPKRTKVIDLSGAAGSALLEALKKVGVIGR
jgi:hypothetical protein